MARPRLRSPDQPRWLRGVLWLFELAASLKLAVVLVLSAAAVLATATFVESQYGLRAVHFGIYGTWWFTALNALLAVNIFCAAAIRYPWKRYQTGFVITHIGLLTLMFGTLLSRRGGIDAQLLVWEGQENYRAFEDSEHFELEISPASDSSSGLTRVVQVPFRPGPFNWQDYAHLARLPWRLAERDRGLVYDRDGVRLELLDYYSNCREVDAPLLRLKLTNPRGTRVDDQGRHVEGAESFSSVELHVGQVDGPFAATRPYGLGDRQPMGGGNLVFWMTGSDAEEAAFRASAPELPLGPQGQVVLWAGGERHVVAVDQHLGKGRFPLGGGGYEAEIVAYFATARLRGTPSQSLELVESSTDGRAERPAVELKVYPPQGGAETPPAQLVLFADLPEFNQQGHSAKVYGSYWYDYGEKTAAELMRGEGGSRIDILYIPGGKLVYRYWNRHEVVALAELPTDGSLVDAFKMPIAQLRMKVDELITADGPSKRLLPLPFDKNMTAPDSNRAALVRLTVDGQADEFWILGPRIMFVDQPPTGVAKHTVAGDGRQVTLTMPLDEIDVGFQVRLHKFSRKLDPGTSTPSHYGSLVDLVDRNDSGKVLESRMEISMNAPIDFTDPHSGRSYRLFQESFRGPFPPGSDVYELVYGQSPAADSSPKFNSVLTVNYDPGRGIKYLGCLLIVAGIATMFYMRAYFFTRPPTARAAASPSRDEPAELAEIGARG